MSPAPFPHHQLPCGMPSFAYVILSFYFIASLHCVRGENGQFMQCHSKTSWEYSIIFIIFNSHQTHIMLYRSSMSKHMVIREVETWWFWYLLVSVCECEISKLLGHSLSREKWQLMFHLCNTDCHSQKVWVYMFPACWEVYDPLGLSIILSFCC